MFLDIILKKLALSACGLAVLASFLMFCTGQIALGFGMSALAVIFALEIWMQTLKAEQRGEGKL